MLKRLCAALLTAAVSAGAFLTSLPALRAEALLFTPNCTVQSESAVLMNLDIGEIVYEKGADIKQMPAQLVQIMTAVVVLEECDDPTKKRLTAEEEMYDIFRGAEYQEDLRYANIEAGDTLTVEDLLYAMMLTSSCEAAQMLVTEFGGGDEDKFTEKMNEKAAELGMTNTRFTNGTGLYSARNVTTARDMMTLVQYAVNNVPRFDVIASANAYTPPSADGEGRTDDWTWTHSNLMTQETSEYFYNGVRGIKTSNSQEGGRCIACKGSRDGNNYLLVCLNSPLEDPEGESHFYHLEDAKNILDWAFIHLTFQDVLDESALLGQVKVNNAEGDDVVVLRPAQGYSCIWCDTTDINSVQQIFDKPAEVDAPVKAGDKLGTVTLKLSGDTLAEIDLIAASSVERSFWKYNLSEIPGFFRSKYLKRTWVLAIVFSLIYIALCVFFAFRYHEERKKRAAARAGHLQSRNQR